MTQKYQDFDEKPVKLDEKDKKILKLLNKDARITLTNISKKTGIPIDTIRYRITEMKRKNVFNYAVIINPLKIGYPIFNVLYLQLINLDEKNEKELVSFVKKHPYLAYSAKISGKYDFAIGIIAKNMKQFDAITNEIKTKFQHIIKDIDIFHIIEEHKYDYMIDLI